MLGNVSSAYNLTLQDTWGIGGAIKMLVWLGKGEWDGGG